MISAYFICSCLVSSLENEFNGLRWIGGKNWEQNLNRNQYSLENVRNVIF